MDYSFTDSDFYRQKTKFDMLHLLGEAFSAIIDGLYFFSFVSNAWRYILSSNYRIQKNIEWQKMRSIDVAQETILLLVGFLISIILISILFYLTFKTISN